MKKMILALLAIVVTVLFNVQSSFGNESVITVYTETETGRINKNVFGNNFLGYDPASYEERHRIYYGLSDYGAGAWDPRQKKPVKEVMDLAKQAGLSILRFPGGCGAHFYNWRDAVGGGRRHFLYGLEEFLRTATEIGAEAVFTVSYFTGNEEDAADLVRYLNIIPDRGNNSERSTKRTGHPLRVKYFEIGNEIWHGNHRNIKEVRPEEYARRYLKYYEAMKAVDPSVQIGVVLHTDRWNRKVMGIVRDKLDFGILHIYPTPVWGKKLERMRPESIFSVSLAIPVLKDVFNIPYTRDLLKEKAGREIPLAITEFNGGFVQDKPVPYRHSLGTALLNADLLRVFMNPEHGIIMANFWQFSNSYWGMIKSEGDFMRYDYRNPIFYRKRPNYYVYELYNKYFGDTLIKTDVKTSSYEPSRYKPYLGMLARRIKSGTIIKRNLLPRRWEIRKFPGAFTKEKDGVLEIDFKNPKGSNYYHSKKRAGVQPDTYYRLSGYIRTEGLTGKKGICLEILNAGGAAGNPLATNTRQIAGTTGWQYVETVYKTPLNTEYVIIRARKIGTKDLLKGRAFIKDVRLEKYVPSLDTRIPYLSVNAARSRDGGSIYLMVINKNLDQGIRSTIDLKDFVPAGEANIRVLNGPAIDATNEDFPENVSVSHRKISIDKNSFEFTFQPHSLTSIEIKRIK